MGNISLRFCIFCKCFWWAPRDADAHWDAASQGARSASQCSDALGMMHPNEHHKPAPRPPAHIVNIDFYSREGVYLYIYMILSLSIYIYIYIYIYICMYVYIYIYTHILYLFVYISHLSHPSHALINNINQQPSTNNHQP